MALSSKEDLSYKETSPELMGSRESRRRQRLRDDLYSAHDHSDSSRQYNDGRLLVKSLSVAGGVS